MTTETGWYGYTTPIPEQPYPEQPYYGQQGDQGADYGYTYAYAPEPVPPPEQQWPSWQQWSNAPAPQPPYDPYDPYEHQYQYQQHASYAPVSEPYTGYDTHLPYAEQLHYEPTATMTVVTEPPYGYYDHAAEHDVGVVDLDELDLNELELDLEFESLALDEQTDDQPDGPAEESAAAGTPLPSGGRAAARAARGRSTRRRSAVLTIAVPSVAVLGIAGAAAATLVPGAHSHAHTVAAATDASATPTAAEQKAEALAAAQAKASAEQASRDEARQALLLRTAAAKKKAAEAPRYVLPISEHTGLSALFGQAGTRWMQLHTGIDFPVSVGTDVHAVTDGTISTKWNPFYGNMLILTAPDGTETWYCHLSEYKRRSGTVKAGDIVAYSGDTGNSTGPHLHFEVHPGGGPAVDPLPWLLEHGLDPR